VIQPASYSIQGFSRFAIPPEAMIQSISLKEDYWNNSDYAVPIFSSEAKYHKPI